MTAHSRFAPSAAHRWLRCPGSVALEAQCLPSESPYAEEGTRAHRMAADLLGGRAVVDPDADAEMHAYVSAYTGAVRDAAGGHQVLIEQRVDFSEALGQPDCFGTADALVIAPDEIQIHDLKYGRGVEVEAEGNEQLMLYALGALSDFGYLYDYGRVTLAIHQPRLGRMRAWSVTVPDLEAWAATARASAAAIADGSTDLVPGETQCRFCRAKATCPALAVKTGEIVAAEFPDYSVTPAAAFADAVEALPLSDRIGYYLDHVDLIEGWCKAVREEAYRRLAEGQDVPGYKLVAGRKGARKWIDEHEAEAALKNMRIKADEMYEMSLISPTAAEKLHTSGVIGPRQWPKLQGLIAQADGKPSVAPVTDARPAIRIAAQADDFETLD